VRPHHRFLMTTVAAASLFVAACGGPAVSATAPTTTPAAAAAASTSASAATSAAVPASVPTAAATALTTTTPSTNSTSAPTTTTGPATSTAGPSSSAAPTAASSQGSIRYAIVASGSKADYRVREQLARLSFPTDAVGTTTALSGDLVLGADGKIDSGQSKITVDLTSLQSDTSMRDRYIQGNVLDTSDYPMATFVPTAIEGLPTPLLTAGQKTFKIAGNLTVHGVTKPLTFNVTAHANGKDVTGQATTTFTFEDFGVTPPKTMAVLSVNDDIKLEVTLHLTRSA